MVSLHNHAHSLFLTRSLVSLCLASALWVPLRAEPADGGRNEYGVFRTVSPTRFIPLFSPEFVAPAKSGLPDSARVIGLSVKGDSRCYPLRQMWYHHIANDTVGGVDVAVTYCVMADTAVTYLRESPEERFVVSGLFGGVLALRKEGTDEIWPQIADVPVPDNPTSRTLRIGPAPLLTTLGRWKAVHPDTRVLAPVEEFQTFYEAYDQRPRGYNTNALMNETVTHQDSRLGPGEEVFGVSVGQTARAWTLETLRKAGRVESIVAGRKLTIVWDEALQTPRLEPGFDGLSMRSYWYAWCCFYPMTELENSNAAKEAVQP